MKLAEEYFQRLLHSDDEVSAVFELDSMWCARGGRSANEPCFGLSRPEFYVHAYLLYQGEVGNGGHRQFFMNSAGNHVSEILEALRRLGFDEACNILKEACSVFPGGEVPRNSVPRNALLESLDAGRLAALDALDKRLYEIAGGYWGELLQYLREHEREVLVAERA